MVAVVFAIATFIMPNSTLASSSQLQQQINEKTQQSNAIKSEIANNQAQLNEKQKQTATLKNQLDILEQDLQNTQLEIEEKQTDIEKTTLEITQTQQRIDETNAKIQHEKEVIGELIRTVNTYDRQSPITIILSSEQSFSDVFNNVQYVENMQDKVKQALEDIKKLKSELEFQRQQLDSKKDTLEKEKQDLDNKKKALDIKKGEQQQLLQQTQNEEAKYQQMLSQAKADYDASNAEIAQLEKQLREENLRYGEPGPFNGVFGWPLPSGMGVISCGFHCPNYFSGLVHTGLDLAAPTGTPIYSATDGLIVHSGWSANGGGYGYYIAVQSGQYLILYGHMNPSSGQPHQAGEHITRGTNIGYVGCTGFCSGPHLHFEVRVNGVPTNPLNFL